MKTKPSFYSLFVSAILVSTNLYAESTNLSGEVEEVTIQAVPHDFSPKFSSGYSPYNPRDLQAIKWMQKSILSGDGKHLLIRAASLKDGVFEYGGPGSGPAPIPDYHALLSGDKFEKRENIAGMALAFEYEGRDQYMTISKDAQIIAVNQNIMGGDFYFIKEGNSYKLRDLKFSKEHYNDPEEMHIYGVTGSGLLYGGIGHPWSYQNGEDQLDQHPPRIFLYDPKTKTMIRTVEAVKDWIKLVNSEINLDDSVSNQILSASYDGSVVVTKLNDIYNNGYNPSKLLNSFYIYYGDNWNKHKKIQLEGAFPENRIFGDYHVALSADGKVAAFGGYVYSGEDYNTTTNLTKQVDGKDNTDKKFIVVNAINKDGYILGGGIGNGISEDFSTIDMRPIIWYGKDWAKTKDLGTLGGKDSDVGIVHSMSDDGKVAAGMSTDADGKYVPTLWYLIEKNTAPALINPEQTKADIINIGQEALVVLQSERHGLVELQEGCRVEEGEGHYCIEQNSTLTGQEESREVKVGVSMAYALTDNVSVGTMIERSIYNNDFDSNNHRNLGIGLFAEWRNRQEDKEFYIRPAMSFSTYRGNLSRGVKAGTEYAEGKMNMKGTALSLTLGQQYYLEDSSKLDWFAGFRYINLKQKGYQDSGENFPIQYNGMRYKEGSVFAGLGFTKVITDKLSWFSKLELEQAIYQRNPAFYAYNEYLGLIGFKQKLAQNSLRLNSGLEYKFNENFRISVIPGLIKASAQPLRWNVGLYLTGQF